jgi:CBS domain-containing protein
MEQTVAKGEPAACPGARDTDDPRAEQRRLRVSDVMSTEVVTIAAGETVFSAVARMSEYGVSSVIVLGPQGLAGILTEKDVLRGVAQCDAEFRRLQVSQRMSSPAQVIPAEASLLEASHLMETRGIKRLPVVENGQLVGIVTQTDLTRGLISMSALRYVRDIMTPQVTTVDTETTADEAARLMSTRNISCLVTRHRRQIAGVVTEKDLLRRVVALHRNPAQTRVAEIMSFPIVSVSPAYSVLSASKKMETMHLHRLVVMDDHEVCGIVTQTDVLRALYGAFATLESQRSALVMQLTNLLRSLVHDAEKLQSFLCDLQNAPGAPGASGAAPRGAPGQEEPPLAGGPYVL